MVKRNLVRAFVVFASVAVALNLVAAAESFQNDLWAIGIGYFAIAAGLTMALVIHWYATHRQAPYIWRDEAWGHERWREEEHDDDVWREYDDEDPDHRSER